MINPQRLEIEIDALYKVIDGAKTKEQIDNAFERIGQYERMYKSMTGKFYIQNHEEITRRNEK
jgi:hypothetical protein